MVKNLRESTTVKNPQRSTVDSVFGGAHQVRDLTNKTWALAPKCPMFMRKQQKGGEAKYSRTNRLVRSHVYQIVASGAALYAQTVLQEEAAVLRTTIGKEKKRVPWLPRLSKGGVAMIEHFLCAYAQEAMRHAAAIRVANNTGKRLTAALVRAGFEEVNSAIADATSLVPSGAVFMKAPSKNQKKSDKRNQQDGQRERTDDGLGMEDEEMAVESDA